MKFIIITLAIGFTALVISKIIKKVKNSSGAINQERLKEITENMGYRGGYEKTAQMTLDMVIHLYHINPRRLKFEYPASRHYAGRGKYTAEYKQLFYNGNQKDKIETSNFCAIDDGHGNIIRREICDMPLFRGTYGSTIPINTTTIVKKKAEDNWTTDTTVSIILSDRDYNKLLKLIEEEEKRKEENKKLEDTKFVLDSAQRDLDKMKVQVNAEIENANTMMQEVMNNVRAHQ